MLNNLRLNVLSSIKLLADKVKPIGDEANPFYPALYKCASSQGELAGIHRNYSHPYIQRLPWL